MADGTITFSTALDNSQLERDIKDAGKRVDELKKATEKADRQRIRVEIEHDEADQAIRDIEQEIAELEGRKASLEATDPADMAGYHAAQQELAAVNAELEEARAKKEALIKRADELNERWQEIDTTVGHYEEQLEDATSRADDLGQRLAEQVAGSAGRTEEALEKARGKMGELAETSASATSEIGTHFDALGRRLATMVKRVFVFQVLLSALRSLRSMISGTLMENERLSASVAGLKAAFQGVVNYVAATVAPVLIRAVNAATVAITNLARLVDSVFGTNIVAAIQRARASAEAAWRQTSASNAATSAAERQAKAAKKLAKAQDKATKSVLGFDEINALNADDTNAAADALGDEAGAVGDGLNPDWDSLDVGKIDAKLAELMLILGAALLAVGAILAFSGINIPLGLTLMAIGAALMYGAYQENWDKLPEQVRSAITGMLVVTGIVLLCLGAVLAFSGANLPLGIGMMVAGAILMWTAVALNWKSLSDNMRVAVSAVMAIVSVALLVIGAVLAFSNPASAPLGIALMVAGAASLAATVAINWKSMPQSVQAVVTTIMSVLAGALIVVGAILALSGAGVALGVGLMLAGAVVLGSAVALNWESMTENVRHVVSAIAAIVSVAFIVVGAILAFTGAAAPLGIALIIAGMAGAVTVAKVNWNFILDKLRTAWNAITQWFHSNVARVLTSSFWNDKFKPIADGLVNALNSALGAVSRFVSSASSMIGGLLGLFGGGFSFRISTPRIPHLAQGAVIPPNSEFMAVLGDQRSGNNIEAPEELMRQIVREEAGAMLADAISALSSGGGAERDVVLVVGHTELARATVRGLRDLSNTGELGRLGLALS